MTDLLKVLAEAALQQLGIFMKQDELEVVHHRAGIPPALAALLESVARLGK